MAGLTVSYENSTAYHGMGELVSRLLRVGPRRLQEHGSNVPLKRHQIIVDVHSLVGPSRLQQHGGNVPRKRHRIIVDVHSLVDLMQERDVQDETQIARGHHQIILVKVFCAQMKLDDLAPVTRVPFDVRIFVVRTLQMCVLFFNIRLKNIFVDMRGSRRNVEINLTAMIVTVHIHVRRITRKFELVMHGFLVGICVVEIFLTKQLLENFAQNKELARDIMPSLRPWVVTKHHVYSRVHKNTTDTMS